MSNPLSNGKNGDRGDGRDASGRFIAKPGPGRPPGPSSRLRTLVDAVDDSRLAEIFDAMIAAAIGGDVAAAKLVLSYVVGQPPTNDIETKISDLESLIHHLETENGKSQHQETH